MAIANLLLAAAVGLDKDEALPPKVEQHGAAVRHLPARLQHRRPDVRG